MYKLKSDKIALDAESIQVRPYPPEIGPAKDPFLL